MSEPKIETQPQRGIVEYRRTPFDGKARTFQRVIESTRDHVDLENKFWADPIWRAGTKKIEILSMTWPDKD